MFSLNELPKVVVRSKKRLGRGLGSGKGGHTSSRGQKGQKSRSTIHPLFEGTKVKKSLIQRLPLQRGKGKLKPKFQTKVVITLEQLNTLPDGSVVTLELLRKHGLLTTQKKAKVKILSQGEINKKLTINMPLSVKASEKIKKAGGMIGAK